MSFQFSMPVPVDFRFAECLAFLNRSKDDILHVVEDASVQKVLNVDSKPVLCELESADKELKITIDRPEIPDTLRSHISSYIRIWFDLERDLTQFYHLAEGDQVLQVPVQRYRGLRLLIIQDLFEALAWAIIGQQINLAFAYKLYRRFIMSFGASYSFRDREYWLFPRPDIIAALRPEDLISLQMTSMKSKYLIEVAGAIASGEISREQLLTRNTQDAFDALVGLKGVGPWTANYVMMRCLGCLTALPLEDVGLHHAIRHFLNLPGKPSIGQVRDIASNWPGWEAYATFYLYRAMIDVKR